MNNKPPADKLIRRILADADPRNDGRPAIDRLRQVAPMLGARVDLLLCDYLDNATGKLLFDDSQLQQSHDAYLSGLEAWLAERAAELADAGVDVDTRMAWDDTRYEAILSAARETGADLILRGAREHSKLERLLVSATDWELIRRAPQTLWLVKQKPARSRSGINVLAAIDPVHAQEQTLGLDRRILRFAAGLAAASGGMLHAFHAWQPGAAVAPAVAAGPHVPVPVVSVDAKLIDDMRRERQKLVTETVQAFDVPDARVHLREGAVTSELDDLIGEHDIDVIVAGGVSRGRIERFVIGSTAEAILESVDCDVVVVKPDGFGADDA